MPQNTTFLVLVDEIAIVLEMNSNIVIALYAKTPKDTANIVKDGEVLILWAQAQLVFTIG